MAIYWDESAMKAVPTTASILAIGDSWFWYPMPGGSLANCLGAMVDTKGHVILAKGMNGAEAYDYVAGKYKRQVQEALRLYGSGLSAVFISGGGNDFAGFNDLRPLLKSNCAGESDARGCFRAGQNGIKAFFSNVDQCYRALIGQVYTRTPLSCHIVMHTYDYAIPTGKGVFGGAGWLKPALDDAQVPQTLQQPCIRFLIDNFHAVLTDIAKGDPDHLHVVDSRSVLAAGDWANELHPRGAGFRKIAEQRWRPVLESLGLA